MSNVANPAPEIKHHPQGGELSDIGQLPFGLDPIASPIIDRHFPGWQLIGAVATRLVLRKLPDLLNEACDA